MGLAFATSAADIETCETWRRISAIGWGSAYSIILHFILIITGYKKLLNKWWFYILLYLPAAITILAFTLPSNLNQAPYHLQLTECGWVNMAKVAEYNIWDWIFSVYYIGYTIIGLGFVWFWGRKSTEHNKKMQSRYIFMSFVSALVLGTITDVVLSSTSAKLPQVAPIIMLIPIITIFYTIKRHGFMVSRPIERKSSYIRIIFCVIIYVILSFFLTGASAKSGIVEFVNIETFSFRGIIIQIQMLILIYLALKEQKPGCITAFLVNAISIIISIVFMVQNKSTAALPGIISYLGVLLVIALICNYKNRVASNIRKIENQRNRLEESERVLYNMAYYDSLTGLPNKDLFVIDLDQAIQEAKKEGKIFSVAFLDLDSFKSVNDTMGHPTGDIALKEIASRLSSCLEAGDTISRYGGDEFLIKIVNINQVEDIQKIINRIMRVFKNTVMIQEIEYFISASIGIAVYPADGEDSETLIKNADIAMYSTKNKGKKQCVFCSSNLKNDIMRKIRLTNSLYRALENNELFLHYQPQVKVNTQEITGFEALLRWNKKEYGMITPEVFIPLAEQTGLIRPIGLWVIKVACEQHKIFKDLSNKDITMSVNISVEQLKDTHIADHIKNILDETRTEPRDIQLEITESITFNKEPNLFQRLKEIKDLGIAISIDDFGTGHSSLSRLKAFPIDVLKIDMEFVRGITSGSQKGKAIIDSIIQIAKNLRVEVLAEGVETEEQFAYLKERNCDKIQGYYFYKPMPPKEIEEILLRNVKYH